MAGGNKFRVKVYDLDDQGEWADRGTGRVQVELVQAVNAWFVLVRAEEGGSTLLESKVMVAGADPYQRQGATILSWVDPHTNKEVALSFAEANSCQAIWERLCELRGQDPAPPPDSPPPPVACSVPPMDGENGLDELLHYLGLISPDLRPAVAAVLAEEGHVVRLVEMFVKAERDRDEALLGKLHTAIKALLGLADQSLLELLLNDTNYLHTFGMLEHGPSTPRAPHREFFTEARLVQPVPLDPAVVDDIHLLFRAQYLKDTALARDITDGTFMALSSLTATKSTEIVVAIQTSPTVLPSVAGTLAMHRADDWGLVHLEHVLFLKELVRLSNTMSANGIVSDGQEEFFTALRTSGCVDGVGTVLAYGRPNARAVAAEILAACAQGSPGGVRTAMLDSGRDYPLVRAVVWEAVRSPQHTVQEQLVEVLCALLNSEGMEPQDKNHFLNVFYERYLDILGDALLPIGSQDLKGEYTNEASHLELPSSPEDRNRLRAHVCDVLCVCLRHHSFRIKYFVLRNAVLSRVCALLSEPHSRLGLAALRFVRTCVATKDEFYLRLMVKADAFAPIVEHFFSNGSRYNLVNSTILELFEFIRGEELATLVTYIVGKFPRLREVAYVEVFEGLWKVHEDLVDAWAERNDDLGTDSKQDSDASSEQSD